MNFTSGQSRIHVNMLNLLFYIYIYFSIGLPYAYFFFFTCSSNGSNLVVSYLTSPNHYTFIYGVSNQHLTFSRQLGYSHLNYGQIHLTSICLVSISIECLPLLFRGIHVDIYNMFLNYPNIKHHESF